MTAVLFDGSNVYNRLREIYPLPQPLPRIDYTKLANWVSDTRLNKKIYYAGRIKAKPGDLHSIGMMKSQQKLTTKLLNAGWEIKLGYIMESFGEFHEKGVDVNIATDLLIGAYENLYNTVYLVSSDTDLIPAIEKAISKGLRIVYVGFEHNPSNGLKGNCSEFKLISKSDLERNCLSL